MIDSKKGCIKVSNDFFYWNSENRLLPFRQKQAKKDCILPVKPRPKSRRTGLAPAKIDSVYFRIHSFSQNN